MTEDGIDEGIGGDDNAQDGLQMAEGSNGVTFSDHVDDIVGGINAVGLTGTGEGDDDESYYSYDEGYYDNAFVGAVTMESVDDNLPLPEVEPSRRKVVIDDIHRIVTDKSPMSRADQGGGPPGSLKADRLMVDGTGQPKSSKSTPVPTSTKPTRRGKQTKEKDRLTGTDALKEVILKGKPTVVE